MAYSVRGAGTGVYGPVTRSKIASHVASAISSRCDRSAYRSTGPSQSRTSCRLHDGRSGGRCVVGLEQGLAVGDGLGVAVAHGDLLSRPRRIVSGERAKHDDLDEHGDLTPTARLQERSPPGLPHVVGL